MPKWLFIVLVVIAVGFVALFGLSIVAGFLVPTLLSGRSEAYKIQCMNNLRELAKGGMLYIQTSGSRFFPHNPDGSLASLQILAEMEDLRSPQLFLCPESLDGMARTVDGKISLTAETCSYEMVPWKVSVTDAGAILFYDKSPHHNGARMVVYTDSSVSSMTEAEFQSEFEKNRVRLGSK